MRSILIALIVLTALLAACAPNPTVLPTQASGYPANEPTQLASTITPETGDGYPVSEPTLASTPEAHEPASTPTTAVVVGTGYRLAYIGTDGNLYIQDSIGGASQETSDALGFTQANPNPDRTIAYRDPQWSSDGRMLAFIHETSSQVQDGYNYTWDLQVWDSSADEIRTLVAGQQFAGFAWRPGTYSIAYGVDIPIEYFISGSTTKISGLKAVDASTGQVTDLVKPENDRPLVNPEFSRDGSIVAFQEVIQMEGAGNFAYYEIPAGGYKSWEKPLGKVEILPDAKRILFDDMVYIATGQENVYLGSLDGAGEPQNITRAASPAFAHFPVLSPSGDEFAYIYSNGDLDSTQYEVLASSIDGTNLRSLGTWENPTSMTWTPDGKHVLISQGPYDSPEIYEIDAITGESRQIASGNQLAVTAG